MEAAPVMITQAVDAWVATPAWALSDAELVAGVDKLHVEQQRLAGVHLALVRELDGRGLAVAQGASSTAVWLRDRLRMSAGAAQRLVRLAAAVEAAPAAVRDGLAAGVLSVEQAQVVTRAVAALPAEAGPAVADKAAATLVSYAGDHEPVGLRRLGEKILQVVAPDTAEEAERAAWERAERRAERDRYLTLSDGGDGSVRLSGRLGAEAAAVVRAALEPLCRPIPGDLRSPGQRRADALVDICRLTLTTDELPDQGGEASQVVVTVDYDVLAGQLGSGLLDTGEALSPEAVRRLACDAQILPAVLDGAGQPLDLGRQRRLVTGALRRALVLRDGGCVFPGCDRPAKWCEGHHIRHWSDGGLTCLSNIVLICGFHHRLVHHGGWSVHIAPDGRPEFTPPTWVDPTQRPRRNHYWPRP
ncbi:MAG TPA: DUF222 domain-containing protein [Micromonosporaceae bacterium]|nr:DUF222 domain-containing protein [Micromonosporaceae bacterium]